MTSVSISSPGDGIPLLGPFFSSTASGRHLRKAVEGPTWGNRHEEGGGTSKMQQTKKKIGRFLRGQSTRNRYHMGWRRREGRTQRTQSLPNCEPAKLERRWLQNGAIRPGHPAIQTTPLAIVFCGLMRRGYRNGATLFDPICVYDLPRDSLFYPSYFFIIFIYISLQGRLSIES